MRHSFVVRKIRQCFQTGRAFQFILLDPLLRVTERLHLINLGKH
jgi:hypothetical protein